MSKIAIFGGTFNPIHNTHISMAKAAIEQNKLDRLYFIPSAISPHKIDKPVVSGASRISMIEAAIEDEPKLFCDDFEIRKSGVSYSYLTVSEYTKRYPKDTLYFLIGSDQIMYFETWKNPDIIVKATIILVVVRSTEEIDSVKAKLNELKHTLGGNYKIVHTDVNNISSTEIRNLASNDLDIAGFVPAKVNDYIINHEVYKTNEYSSSDISKLLSKMKDSLKSSRYEHTVGVTHCVGNLAMSWNYPVYKAMIAGALHDSAKCISDKERIEICEKNDIPITDVEYENPSLLHGKVGAFWANTKYGYPSKEIEHAISFHTTGCPNMNLLDKLLFIADYIEPGRDKAPHLEELRYLAYKDLDMCLYIIFKDTLEYLKDSKKAIDSTTYNTYKFYASKIGTRKESSNYGN